MKKEEIIAGTAAKQEDVCRSSFSVQISENQMKKKQISGKIKKSIGRKHR